MNIESTELEDLGSPIYSDYEKNIYIETGINTNTNILYIKIYKDPLDRKCARLSLLSPEYLESDFKLSNDDIDFIVNILQQKNTSIFWNHLDLTCWECILLAIKEEYKSEDININIDNINIPDYNKLKEKTNNDIK